MSPAGYWPQLRAAVEAGADAVYFGLKHFTARAKVGFTLTELPDALFDAVLANPPYYAQGSIIRLFIERSRLVHDLLLGTVIVRTA